MYSHPRLRAARPCTRPLLWIATLFMCHCAATAQPLAADALLRQPHLRAVELAPDGSSVAYLAGDERTASLRLFDTRTGATRQLLADAGKARLAWSADGTTLFLDDGKGASAIDVGTGQAARIAVFAKGERMLRADGVSPHHVLVERWDAGRYRLSRVGTDGSAETLYDGPRRVYDVLLGADGKLAVIRTLADDYSQLISHRRGGQWTEAMRCRPLRACQPVAISPDGRTITLLAAPDGDRRSLVALDTVTGKQRVLHSDPARVADLGKAVLAPATRQPLLATYDLPRRRSHGLTPAAAKAAADIGRRFPDTDIAIAPSTGNWLLTETGSRLQHPRYWLYQPARRTFREVLADERARGEPLPERQLAAKQPVTYRASDGMPLHGYVTLPPGRAAATAPLVTLVHGGPWSRYDNGYTVLAQFLASRGVAVFQPNFRASTGYGDRYMLAAGTSFGNGRVQQDILDGIGWLLAQGIGRRDRLAIAGDSFGGYTTLLALTHTPAMFRFGLAAAPPTDFTRVLHLADDASRTGSEDVPLAVVFREMGIDTASEAALLPIAADAPARHPERVTQPLVLMAGALDETVALAGVVDYAAQLEGLGKPVTLLVAPDEGHNPRQPVTRAAYLHLLERLLHRYLDGPVPAPAAPQLQRYLDRNVKLDRAFGAG